MSDTPQGPGWWQASDGKYYPPEQAPGGGQPAPAGGGADLGSALSYGFNKFVQNIGDWLVLWLVIVAAFIVVMIVGIVLGAGYSYGTLSFGVGRLVREVLWGAVLGVLLVVIAKGAIAVANGERPELGKCFQLSGNNIVAGIIFGLIYGGLNWIGCGLLGVVAFLLFGLMPVISADRDLGIESLNEALQTSTQRFGEVAIILIIAWLLTGVCALGAPIGMLSLIYVYRNFRGEAIAA